MKARAVFSIISTTLVGPATALAQDPVTVAPTHYKVVFENPSVRVLRIDYAPGRRARCTSTRMPS